ncbi:ScpA family protein [Caulobacter sp. S45]|uniref:segregation and condensation protein A n=1 Tax=Caulobacter sp. S45 TaxID=1641861 RepID=UPI00131E9E04|nr:ScpA family protein [Caulobacter sp. S45]
MNAFQTALDFEVAEAASDQGDALVLALDGFEGPLHLLLALARGQKVDLLKISVARLAEQYLAFVESQRHRRFALAAEYLVMAAWLTYLKSRLLLPKPRKSDDDELPAEELAEALAFRLAKLDAMRGAADTLKRLPRFGLDVFGRGDPEARVVQALGPPEGDLYALISAYADQRVRQTARRYTAQARVEAYPLEAARDRLRELLPSLDQWTDLHAVAPDVANADQPGPSRASFVASTLSAGLEMVKDGALEVRQLDAFAALYLRARRKAAGQVDQAA